MKIPKFVQIHIMILWAMTLMMSCSHPLVESDSGLWTLIDNILNSFNVPNVTPVTPLPPILDTTAPVPGNSGIITYPNVKNNSINLVWTNGTDDTTIVGALEYRVVQSMANNISTLSDADANGTVVQDWTPALTSALIGGLDLRTADYYFNVIVRDAAGNRALYATANTRSTRWLAFGGSTTTNDYGTGIVLTTDGGYVVTGFTWDCSSWPADTPIVSGLACQAGHNMEIFVLKYDPAGNRQWLAFIGGTLDDLAQAIIQTTDGGYAIAATTGNDVGWPGTSINPHSLDSDLGLIKLNADGTYAWHTNIGGNLAENALAVQQTSDGGYIVGGITDNGTVPGWPVGPINPPSMNGDMVLAKVDGSGNGLWYTFMGGPSFDTLRDLKVTSSGGIIVAGLTQDTVWAGFPAPVLGPHGNPDAVLIKLDSGGNVTQHTFAGGTVGNDAAMSVAQTSDSGFIVTGYTDSSANWTTMGMLPVQGPFSGNDIVLMKYDNALNLSWFTFVGGTSNEIGYSVIQDTDGGYVVAGIADSSVVSWAPGAPLHVPMGLSEIFLTKVSATGSCDWYTFAGGSMNDGSGYTKLIKASDGGFAVVAPSQSDSGWPVFPVPRYPHSAGSNTDFMVLKFLSDGNLF